jgi:hypothetical protein
LTLAATTAGFTLAVASPALADGCVQLPDNRGFACLSNNNRTAQVRDERADNWGVRVHVWSSIPGTKYVVGDGNGSASGDGWKYARSGETFTSAKVCAGVGGVDTVCSRVFY